ncbi:TetR/AcrR family transcriptional regulator [Mangrovimicrobium sediminis]|uniref:TetR/AcrR family transcriptional regulator n=1 Tax=Mangrovimicrobium sediminis TaxID=2562682 RepID=A0A4Z0M3S9_9GAMM|nr:TetR/AcrR family transcriptional regulator [Haliea sp. SAOS-164]TGD74161.1 TetR/AcrR family transcriptional regulator [Haliea sp. SAOS-164]
MTSTESTAPAQGDNAKTDAKPRVRDRIVDAASALFYQQGINCVGVDAIVCEAGTNKMSLYRNFGSKDELVVEYLAGREADNFAQWDEVTARYPDDPRRQIEALFAHIIAKGQSKSSSGCPSANAAIELRGTEHPGRQVVFDGRLRARRFMLERAEAAGAKSPEVLADALVLLLEGAVMSRLSYPEGEWPANNMDAVLKVMLDAQLGAAD